MGIYHSKLNILDKLVYYIYYTNDMLLYIVIHLSLSALLFVSYV